MPPTTRIPTRALILCDGFGPRLGALRVGEALAGGLSRPAPPRRTSAPSRPAGPGQDIRELLDGGIDSILGCAPPGR